MSPSARLACGWLTLFVVGTDLFVISPLLPRIANDFGRSAAGAGLSVTVFSLTYLLCAPMFGRIADRIGRRRTLIPCLLSFAVANVLTGMAPNFGWLLVARIATGAAASGVSPLIYAGVGEAAPPERRATWMAIAVSGLLLALSVGAPIGALLASVWGWRAPFFVLAVLCLGLIVANRMVWPADVQAGNGQAAATSPLRAGSAALRLLPTVLWATALYGVYTYLGTWLTGAGLSPSGIANAIACYGIGALVGTLLGGQLADRFGTTQTMLTSLAGLIVCLVLFGIGVGTGAVADALLAVMSVFAQFFFPAQQARLAREFPGHRAFMLAMNNSALFLGISLGSLIGGEAITRSGFQADAGVAAIIACGSLITIAATRRPRS